MQRPVLAIAFLFLSLVTTAQTSPDFIKPKVWLRGDVGNITPLIWSDVSGNKHHATALADEGPTDSISFNFNTAILFDGVNDYMKVPYSLERTSELSVLSVFHSNDTTERGMWGIEDAVNRNIMLTTRRVFGPDTIADHYGKNENRAVLNTLVQNWVKAVTTDSSAYLALGSTGKAKNDKPFKGAISELIIFDRAITFLERIQYETYLAIKYGTSLKDQNYVSSASKLLWNASENKEYTDRLAGIGRDDAFLLYQKQSRSAYDSGFLTISAGKIAVTNAGNSSTINIGDFLVWGDNNLPKTDKPGDGADSMLSIVQRRWLITATGNTVNQLPTELYIDVSKLPNNAEGYWLIVDRSGQGNFHVDNVEYILVDRITPDGKAVYKVLWDTDQSGKDNFGFARAKDLFVVVRKLDDPSCTNETAGKVRIEVVAGKPSYKFKLANQTKVLREWDGQGRSVEQDGLSGGNYVLTVKDKNRDQLTRNFTLTLPDALQIDVGEDQRLLPGKEIVLDVRAQVPDSIPVTFLWQNNFGFSSEESKVTITESGIYTVTVTKQKDGCVFSDEITISGTEEQKLAVFPTVISRGDHYNVSVSIPETGSITIQVLDLKGNVYQEWTGRGKTEYLFKGTLSGAGMYLVKVNTPKGVQSAKLIVN